MDVIEFKNQTVVIPVWSERARFEVDGAAQRKYVGLLFPVWEADTIDFIDCLKFGLDLDYLGADSIKILREQATESRLKDSQNSIREIVAAKAKSSRLVQRMVSLRYLDEIVEYCGGKKDHYLSQNTFSFEGRKIENLRSLSSAWVDLDYYKVDSELCAHLFDDDVAIRSILLVCENENIPIPTQIVRSGRGLLVRWIFTTFVPQQAISRWNLVMSTMCRHFVDFGADPKSMDAAHVFRVLGSVNAKNEQTVREIFSARRVSFDLISDAVLPCKRLTLNQINAVKAHKVGGTGTDISSARDISWHAIDAAKSTSLRSTRWCAGVMGDVLTLIQIRNKKMVGHREFAAFIYLNFKLLSGWKPTFEEYSNDALKVSSLTGDTAFMGEVCAAVKGLWDRFKKGQGAYRYKRATLIELFAIDQEEQSQLKMLRTQNSRAQRKKHADVETVNLCRQLAMCGLKKAEIATLLGVPTRTIRYWCSGYVTAT